MRVLVVVGLVLFLLVQPAVSQVPDDRLIVPGQRIGKWTLDMTISALVEMNGARTPAAWGMRRPVDLWAELGDLDVLDNVWGHSWGNLQFLAGTLGQDSQRVVFLATESKDHKTAQGIGVDAPRQDVEATYGKPTATTVRTIRRGSVRVIYDDTGLAVAFVLDRARLFFVFKPGTAKSIWKY